VATKAKVNALNPDSDRDFRPATYWPGSPVGIARGTDLPLLGEAPGFGDGSFLPPLGRAEVEIAAVGLQSTTGDVISVSARPVAGGIRFRIVDEYGTRFQIKRLVRRQPLTFGEFVELLDTARHEGMVGLLEAYLDLNYEGLEDDISPASLSGFVQARSLFYPQLEELYRARSRAWVKRRQQESAQRRRRASELAES
jgi:hypothetical protein